MNPAEIAAIITATALSLAQGKSADEALFLSAIFTQLGAVLATIATAPEQNNISNANANSSDSKSDNT